MEAAAVGVNASSSSLQALGKWQGFCCGGVRHGAGRVGEDPRNSCYSKEASCFFRPSVFSLWSLLIDGFRAVSYIGAKIQLIGYEIFITSLYVHQRRAL